MRRRTAGPAFPEWMTAPLVADYLSADEVADPGWQVTAYTRHVRRVEEWRLAHRLGQEDVPVEVPRLVAP